MLADIVKFMGTPFFAIDNFETCLLCLGRARVVSDGQPGYKAGSSFSIVHCEHCNSSRADPLEVAVDVYEEIYTAESIIRGYERYGRYADAVLSVIDPLEYLAQQEDVYWGVKVALESRALAGGRVLDVGSGLGYLTFALRRAGYDAHGLDISNSAVVRSRGNYGPFYYHGDVVDFSQKREASYDVVVLSEVIEHVPEPMQFLESARRLLAPGGVLIITTPNKSYHEPTVLWETDPPPVHLWWFSEDTLKIIAKKINMKMELIDFTHFNEQACQTYIKVVGGWTVTRGPRIDSHGRGIPRTTSSVAALLSEGSLFGRTLVGSMKRIRDVISPRRVRFAARSFSLCAVFEKTSVHMG